MKKKDSVTLNASRTAGIILAVIGVPGLLLMLVLPTPRSTFFFTLFIITGSLIACFLADYFTRVRITLTNTEVQLHVRRTGETISLPWTDFSCLYELPGWKMRIYLLTPAPMDKVTQLATYKACCRNTAVPYTHEGCLILNAYVHGSVIDLYLPAHIQKMPWSHCARL
ncbi:MAG: hypothetical protein IJB81_07870 [Clostridia bacterium]|nr:hypothetical protein [Clostridia bacterium]